MLMTYGSYGRQQSPGASGCMCLILAHLLGNFQPVLGSLKVPREEREGKKRGQVSAEREGKKSGRRRGTKGRRMVLLSLAN